MFLIEDLQKYVSTYNIEWSVGALDSDLAVRSRVVESIPTPSMGVSSASFRTRRRCVYIMHKNIEIGINIGIGKEHLSFEF